MNRPWLAAAAALAAATSAPAAAQTVQAGGLELDLSGRVQIQLNTTTVTDDDVGLGGAPASVAFETRRMQFGTAFSFDAWLSGLVLVDFAGATASLTDGFIDAALADGLTVRMGQLKKPFGVFDLESDTRTLTIERGVRIPGLTGVVGVPGDPAVLLAGSGYSGRQIGVAVQGAAGALGYAAGVFNGEGTNTRETRGSKGYAARATYALDGAGRPLVVGGGVSVQPTGVFDADGSEVHARAFAVDAELGAFRRPGVHVIAELMYGDSPLAMVGTDPPSMAGGQVVAGWFMPRDGRIEGLEPVMRLAWASPDLDATGAAGLVLTPGANAYFSGRNRLMVNTEIYVPSADGPDIEYGLTARFQIYF